MISLKNKNQHYPVPSKIPSTTKNSRYVLKLSTYLHTFCWIRQIKIGKKQQN